MSLKKFRSTWWPEILLITLISALVYLPTAGRLSFHSDDWYFIFNGLVNGSKGLIDVALHTRPLRGPLYMLLFDLYGLHPLPYILTLTLWRLLSGLGAIWLFHLLWPRQRETNFLLATLFVVFPGFLWWVSGFEFQPYVLSLALQVFSIIFSLKAVGSDKTWKKVLWVLAAIISGWAYLALVEFAVGMEAFRIISLYLFIKHRQPADSPRQLVTTSARASGIFLLIPVVFVYWYQFIFDNWRRAQQADVQLGKALQDPLTIVNWMVHFFQAMVNITLGAWITPLNINFYSGTPKEYLLRFGLAVLVSGLGLLAFFWLRESDDGPDRRSEMLWLGLLGSAAGVLPVILVNRTVTFNFSHYALPASLAGVLVVGGLVFSLGKRSLRIVAISALLGVATLSHQALAYRAASEESTILNFWWQVTWRTPSIQTGASLLVQYPFDIGNDDSLVWGPASFIYHPQRQDRSPVTVPLSAVVLQPETIKNIEVGGTIEEVDRVISNAVYHYYYDNLLVMTQAGNNTCMRMVNPDWMEFSVSDNALVLEAARHASLESVDTQAVPPAPQRVIFGEEPAHNWCYYYQKADLACQLGDWQAAAQLGNEARQKGLHPNDAIEWMPFLQGYAYSGDTGSMASLAKSFRAEPYYRKQACLALKKMAAAGYPLQPVVMKEGERLFCED